MNEPVQRDLYDIVIIGGGAAGMTAAVCAGRFFTKEGIKGRIALIERHAKLGRKVAATGNGRCNLGNLDAVINKSDHYHSEYPLLYETVLDKFGPEQTICFFESMGILCKSTEDKRIYPFCEQAASVVHAFLQELSACHVDILLMHEIKDIHKVQKPENDTANISKSDDLYKIDGFRTDPDMAIHGATTAKRSFCLLARKIVVTTGGKASPALSSDGSGYRLLHSLSHTTTLLFPGIVQLESETDFVAPLSGLKWNAGISLMRMVPQGGETSERMVRECLRKESGELLFTKYGISGPPVLQLSRHLGGYHRQLEKTYYYAVIDFLETFSTPDLIALLSGRIHEFNERPLRDFLVGIVPFKLATALVRKVFPHRENHPLSSVTGQDLAVLVAQLKMFPIQITGTTGWEEAQVTAGGIRCDELNPETLESHFNRGLYIAGEVLDVDGDCGGYNLQFAWASGFIAGENAARSLLSEKLSEDGALQEGLQL